jgi:hypothetical protein
MLGAFPVNVSFMKTQWPLCFSGHLVVHLSDMGETKGTHSVVAVRYVGLRGGVVHFSCFR